MFLGFCYPTVIEILGIRHLISFEEWKFIWQGLAQMVFYFLPETWCFLISLGTTLWPWPEYTQWVFVSSFLDLLIWNRVWSYGSDKWGLEYKMGQTCPILNFSPAFSIITVSANVSLSYSQSNEFLRPTTWMLEINLLLWWKIWSEGRWHKWWMETW